MMLAGVELYCGEFVPWAPQGAGWACEDLLQPEC
jgi:hypothetical protein